MESFKDDKFWGSSQRKPYYVKVCFLSHHSRQVRWHRGLYDTHFSMSFLLLATACRTSVIMLPGPMAFTLMLCGARETAMHLQSVHILTDYHNEMINRPNARLSAITTISTAIGCLGVCRLA